MGRPLQVRKATDGKGVDVIIDFVGQSYFKQNVASAARDGRMVMLGLLSGGKLEGLELGPILFKRLRIEGTVSVGTAYLFDTSHQRALTDMAPPIVSSRRSDQELQNIRLTSCSASAGRPCRS